MTIDAPVSRTMTTLFPPSMELSLSPTSAGAAPLPSCSANLMPFHIDYDGPAPIDSFLIRQQHSSPAGDESAAQNDSFVSAFRGRAIQSTPLPLPEGFKAKLVAVSQVATAAADAASSSSPSSSAIAGTSRTTAVGQQETEQQQATEREAKRQKTHAQPPPTLPLPSRRAPAKQQKFSMDSDDEEEDQDSDHDHDEDEGNFAYRSNADESGSLPNADDDSGRGEERVIESSNAPQESGPKIRIQSIAEIQPSSSASATGLTIWGADGPIDKGDDTFFRTVGEWYSVITPLVRFLFYLWFSLHQCFETIGCSAKTDNKALSPFFLFITFIILYCHLGTSPIALCGTLLCAAQLHG